MFSVDPNLNLVKWSLDPLPLDRNATAMDIASRREQWPFLQKVSFRRAAQPRSTERRPAVLCVGSISRGVDAGGGVSLHSSEYSRLAWRNGVAHAVTIVCTRIPPGRGGVGYRVQALVSDGAEFCESGFDAFHALQLVRRRLEDDGLLLAVEGARLASYPSGMLRDQASGLKVYRLTLGVAPDTTCLRSTFDQVGEADLATVEEQDRFYRRWVASRVELA